MTPEASKCNWGKGKLANAVAGLAGMADVWSQGALRGIVDNARAGGGRGILDRLDADDTLTA